MSATTLTIADIEAAGELDLGVSGWRRIDQAQIDAFADVTGDHMWLHVDSERAAAGPFGTTVAHGYLTLTLLPSLLGEVLTVSDMRGRINYGIERIRFTGPVPTGSEVRAKARIVRSERRSNGLLYAVAVEVEVNGEAKPALVGELLFLVF